MDKQGLDKLLQEEVVALEFEKADGSIRKMYATLKEDVLPEQEEGNTDKPKRKPNPDVKAVWDIEAGGWRSFRWDRLSTVNGEGFEYGDENE